MYEKILKDSAASSKAWATRRAGGAAASSPAKTSAKPSAPAGKGLTPAQHMQAALAKGMRVKTSGGVSSGANNAYMDHMMTHPDQEMRDAYHKAVSGTDEAGAIKRQINHYKKRGFMEPADAKEALAELGTSGQYALAKAFFGFKAHKPMKSFPTKKTETEHIGSVAAALGIT